MPKIVYEVVEHDGGWAYRASGAFSESFPSHADALAAAMIAATAQQKRLLDELGVSVQDGHGPDDPLDFEILDRHSDKKRFSLSNPL